MRLDELKPDYIVNKRYQITEIIGRGGMGIVAKAIFLDSGSEVAIKFCHLVGDDALRRFAREIRIMRTIKHHHVIPILRVGLKHSPPYFVMPLAESSCAAKLTEYSNNEEAAIRAFLEMCEGVQAIHTSGAVHRDIKPDNALILDGRIVLSDLGLAKLADRDSTILTQTRAIVGTDMYLAPEQRFVGGSRDADIRTDIYQLGKTLYQLVSGLEPALVDFSKTPPGLAHVIRRATREQPNERYQSVGQLVDAILAYQRAKDPDSNPLGAFESALARVNDRLERNEYREDEVQELVQVLGSDAVQQENEQFLELIDSIPKEILVVMTDLFHTDMEPILEHYITVLDDLVSGHGFSYAETVADRMKELVASPKIRASLKSLAIEATLLAAVRLNRFAAMNSLGDMLVSITDDDFAAAVYDVLDRRRTDYKVVSSQVPSLKLHPMIRILRDELADDEE